MMSHSRKTAERSYVRQDLTKLAAQAMDVIKRVTAVKPSGAAKGASEPATLPPSGAQEGPQLEEGAAEPVSSPPSVAQEKPQQEKGTSEPVPSSSQHQPDSSAAQSLVSGPVKSKTILSSKEKECLEKLFKEDIQNKKAFGIDEYVRNNCCTKPTLAVLVSSLKKVKAMINHLNYLVKTIPTIDVRELEQQKEKSK